MSEGKTPAGAEKKWALGCGALAVGVVLLFAGCGALLASGGSNNRGPSEAEARFVCEEWVRDGLRAPATARFSGVTTTASGGVYTIRGDVDAENGFGALLRSGWVCEVRLDGETWRGYARLTE